MNNRNKPHHYSSDFDSERSMAPRDYSQDQYARAQPEESGHVRSFDRTFDEGYRPYRESDSIQNDIQRPNRHADHSQWNRPTIQSDRPAPGNGRDRFGASNGTNDYYRDQSLAPYNDTYQSSQPSQFSNFTNFSSNRSQAGQYQPGQNFSGRLNQTHDDPWTESQSVYGRSEQAYRTPSRGQHSGKGPKGYRRSDERIREEVNEMLESHGDIDASDIEVTVSEGIVTLSGSVDSRRTKRLAEEWTENMSGVKDVRNELGLASQAK